MRSKFGRRVGIIEETVSKLKKILRRKIQFMNQFIVIPSIQKHMNYEERLKFENLLLKNSDEK